MIDIIETKRPNIEYCFYDEDCIFCLEIKDKEGLIGTISIHKHPYDKRGGQLGLEIEKSWRKKWLTRTLAKKMLDALKTTAKKYNLEIIYSTAISSISPRMLEFFGFMEYNFNK